MPNQVMTSALWNDDNSALIVTFVAGSSAEQGPFPSVDRLVWSNGSDRLLMACTGDKGKSKCVVARLCTMDPKTHLEVCNETPKVKILTKLAVKHEWKLINVLVTEPACGNSVEWGSVAYEALDGCDITSGNLNTRQFDNVLLDGIEVVLPSTTGPSQPMSLLDD